MFKRKPISLRDCTYNTIKRIISINKVKRSNNFWVIKIDAVTTVAQEKCTKQPAPIVEKNAKFLSNQQKADLSTAENVTLTIDQREDISQIIICDFKLTRYN